MRTLLVVGGIGVVCKLAALGRELVVAARFGASESLDAFLVAVVIPSTLTNVVGNVLATALLPQLLKTRRDEGPAAELAAQRRACFWSILLLAASGVLLAALGPWIIPFLSPGFRPEGRVLAAQLLWAATPFGIFAGSSRLYAVLAESEGRFTRTSISPLWTAILSVAVIALAGGDSPFLLVAGLTAGGFAELLFNASALRGTRYDAWPGPGRLTGFERLLLAAAWPVSLGAVLHALSTIVDQSMSSLAGTGGVSELSYGNRFVAVSIGLLGTPLLQYAFPRFARQAADHQYERLWFDLRRFSLLAVGIGLTATIVLSGGAGLIVGWTFERGRFTAETADRVALVQALGALQVPFAIVAMLGLRAVFALKLRHVMLIQGAGTVVVNLALDYVLFRWLGVAGIALSSSLVAAGTSLFILLVVKRGVRAAAANVSTPIENKRAA